MAKIPNKIKVAAAGGVMSLAVAMIMYFEGVRYQPYYDVGGVLTVCYGHTGKDIIPDKTYSQAECDALLEKDLAIVAKGVDPLIKVCIPGTTRAALYSFVYNVGTGAFSRSTLLKKLNTNDKEGACHELTRWVYVKEQKWKGLMNRRDIEDAVCAWVLE